MLLKQAAEPIATRPVLRQLLQDIKRQMEQIIDDISVDELIEAGASEKAKQKVQSLVASFEQFIAENRDEIDALQCFYAQPYAQRLLTDLVSLVRFATHQDAELAPFGEHVRARFAHWLAQQRAGRGFTPEQVRWLEMIRDHIAASVEMSLEDFDYAPFAEEGGRGRATQVFGEGLGSLLDELNEVLAA